MRLSARGGIVTVRGTVSQGKFCYRSKFVIFFRRDEPPARMMTLTQEDWKTVAAEHQARAARHTQPARHRRDRGLPHPIEDFLFQYYPYPLALLEAWQAGIGIACEWDTKREETPLPCGISERYHTCTGAFFFADPGKLKEKERERLQWICSLLEASSTRAPNFACHGLHEWAMVYGGHEVRHEKTTRLRLPQREIDALVESRAICCSHHDAFRFFAAAARPLNRLQPSLDSRVQHEQPGCVHANMDLYKWAAKAMPWVGSELLLDCFELALHLRDLDMRASPYDLSEWGREAIKIETSDGRRTYESEQRRLAALAAPLRARLIAALRETLAHPALKHPASGVSDGAPHRTNALRAAADGTIAPLS